MNKAVLITGASTGIGHSAAVGLARQGFKVFAGVRNKKDQENLQAESPSISPLLLDVTLTATIQDAYDILSKQSFDSFHLINNAGIVVAGPVETLSLAEFRHQFDVNFFGLIEVTQKFLPLVRKSKGRIINISSVSGLASTPFMAAYSASKFAVEALSDSLRWEVAASGVKVIVVEPGPIATPIWQKGFRNREKIENSVSGEKKIYYESALNRFEKLVKLEAERAIPVEKVTEVIVKSITSANPPTRIVVASKGAKAQLAFSRHLPQKWIDRTIQKTLFK